MDRRGIGDSKEMAFWGTIIGGTHSGCGKTLVTLGLLRCFAKLGYKVQPFKVGPDYIDPQWHTRACGVPSVNLDLFSFGADLPRLFLRYAKGVDLALVEGVMGFFDGDFSTFEVAKKLNLHVLLVVNVYGLAETLSPLLEGIKRRVKRAGLNFGVFLNGVSSERHFLRLKRALKKTKIVGYLPRKESFVLPSRHLGLFLPDHYQKVEEVIAEVAETLQENLDFSFFNEDKACMVENPSEDLNFYNFPFKKVALAYDQAFSFYYTHFLDELKAKGEVIYFSPLQDVSLPSKAEAIIIGGGYPELFLEELANNTRLKREIKDWVEAGGLLYAECGGLIYLSHAYREGEKLYPMCDLFPFVIERKKLSLKYCRALVRKDNPFFSVGSKLWGHEFHYTQIVGYKERKNFQKIFYIKPYLGKAFSEGFLYKGALATYLHILAIRK